VQDLYDLPARQVMGKFCAVSFYFGEIDEGAFRRKFGVPLAEAFGREVAFALERGLMERASGKLRLTPAGADRVNGVIALFFAPSIQAWLIERDAAEAGDLERNRRRALAVAGEG
jgi:oxygen-independent coproporphyrinogen-3 oxidase